MKNLEKTETFDFEQKPKKPIRWFTIFGAMFWAFFIALALSNVLSPYLSNIISGLLTGISPLIIGIVVAFIFYRFVDFMEKKVMKNAFKNCSFKFGLKRFISITTVVLIIAGLIALFFSILVPRVIDVVKELSAGNGDALQQKINGVVDQICLTLQNWFGAEINQESIKDVLFQIFNTLKDTILQLESLLQLSITVVISAFNFLIGILFAILMLKDKEKITRFTRRFVYVNFKKERADEMCVMARNANRILFDYVICKIIEFFLIVIPLGIVYALLGLKFTWEISLIIAVFNFIPYFGIYIGCVPAILITMVFNFDQTLYMVLTTFIITSIEFNILVPFITGNRLKVSSLVVASSIIIGGAMFGMVGLLLAPPIVAIINVVIMGNIELKENRMKYVLELNKAREQHDKDQSEVMGLSKDNDVGISSSSNKKDKTKVLDAEKSVEELEKSPKTKTKKTSSTSKSTQKKKTSDTDTKKTTKSTSTASKIASKSTRKPKATNSTKKEESVKEVQIEPKKDDVVEPVKTLDKIEGSLPKEDKKESSTDENKKI